MEGTLNGLESEVFGNKSFFNGSGGNKSLLCPVPQPVNYTRFWVVMLGAPFAIFGALMNGVLMLLFFRPKYRTSPALYLAFLAILDVMINTMYILLFPVDAMAIFFRIHWLWILWHRYAMVLFAVSRVVQLASTYLVLTATMERFLLVLNVTTALTSRTGRKVIIFIFFSVSFGLRFFAYFEYDIVNLPNCTEAFQELTFEASLIKNHFYRVVYNFYIMNIVQTFLPFVLLVFLNLGIFIRMSENFKEERSSEIRRSTVIYKSEASIRKMLNKQSARSRLKSVTYTIIAMVTSYLACTSVDLMVKIFENFNEEFLFVDYGTPMQDATDFYRLSGDIVSILFNFNSFLRMPIYLLCNKDVRHDLFTICQKQKDFASERWKKFPSATREVPRSKQRRSEELGNSTAEIQPSPLQHRAVVRLREELDITNATTELLLTSEIHSVTWETNGVGLREEADEDETFPSIDSWMEFETSI